MTVDRRHRRRFSESERGAVAVFLTLTLVVMIGMAALLVDLGQARATSRVGQRAADFAALAAAKNLGVGDAVAGCQDAITYVNANVPRISSPFDANTFCSAISNTCTNATTAATPTATSGDVQVSIHFPVPSTDIPDSYWTGAGKNDGPTQCQRMKVILSVRDRSMFGRIFGATETWSRRSATVRPSTVTASPPALWVLDPTGCPALKVDGGSQVTVGTNAAQGVITVDSRGTSCSGSSSTVSVTGSGTVLTATGPAATPGMINVAALSWDATTCTIPACDPADVAGGRITPQPQHGEPASRAYVDWRWNCKSGYPTFHGVNIFDCPNTPARGGTSYPYVDNLKTAIGTSGTPGTGSWTTIGPGGNQCSPNASITYPVGNYYVKCTRGNNGFVINSGVTVTFAGGNVVFEDNVTVSNGGTLNVNTANTTANLPSNCMPPTVQTPCIGNSSAGAAFMYFRGDSSTMFQTSGTGTVNLNHTFVYGGTGAVSFSGNPPIWTAPIEGPFDALTYWSDMPSTATNAQRSSFTITGGSGANLTGVFFTPEATPFKLAGGGNWGQLQAQFISYQLTVTGGGILSVNPRAGSVYPPSVKGMLIR
jgi:Flp pilus assembly protein TadG